MAVNAWFESWEKAGFEPDGWGALIIIDHGRVFDWLPWCAVASLTVDHQRFPSLEDAVKATLMLHLQTQGAAKCVPKRSHVQRMKMQLLGRLQLDMVRANKVVSKWSNEMAIEFGWSLSDAAFSSNFSSNTLPQGPMVTDLLRTRG